MQKEIHIEQKTHLAIHILGNYYFTPPGVIAGFIVLPFALVFLGEAIITFQSYNLAKLIIPLSSTFISIILSFTLEGFLIDTNKRLYKHCIYFFGQPLGTWIKLPEIEAVTIAPYNFKYQVDDAITPRMTFTENKFKVMLYVKDSERGIIVGIFSRKKAFKAAREISFGMDIPILK